jgi:hypothetical protein
MFKLKVFSLGIIASLLLTLVLGSGTFAKGQTLTSLEQLNELAAKAEKDGIQRAWACDGKGNIHEVTEESGQVEFMDRNTNRAELIAKHAMSPEAEAKIVQTVPPCPVIIDGVLYQPEQIHLFDGQQLGFTVGNDGKLYAFTTDEALDKFVQEQRSQLQTRYTPVPQVLPTYGLFCANAGYIGSLVYGPTGTQIKDLSNIGWNFNDMISSEVIGSSVPDADLYEDTNYQGNYFRQSGPWHSENLSAYGWNDRASSLIIWWF